MNKCIIIKYIFGAKIKFVFRNKKQKYIDFESIKNTRIYIDKPFLLARELAKSESFQYEEKVLLKNFFSFLTKTIIENGNYIIPSFQKIYFKNFRIDVNITEKHFYFEIFDKNKKRVKSEMGKYNSLLKWDYVETKTFIYSFEFLKKINKISLI